MDDWLADEVDNQVRFRDFNEWIKASNDRLATDRVVEEFVCECSDGTCRRVIMLTRLEYESVRAYGARFAIALNHENPELDQVLEQNERFATSEKLPGSGMRRAFAMEPRG
jgi:hypothetical protein